MSAGFKTSHVFMLLLVLMTICATIAAGKFVPTLPVGRPLFSCSKSLKLMALVDDPRGGGGREEAYLRSGEILKDVSLHISYHCRL